jgi:hypothetical protein
MTHWMRLVVAIAMLAVAISMIVRLVRTWPVQRYVYAVHKDGTKTAFKVDEKDATPAIQAAINNSGAAYIPAGVYRAEKLLDKPPHDPNP